MHTLPLLLKYPPRGLQKGNKSTVVWQMTAGTHGAPLLRRCLSVTTGPGATSRRCKKKGVQTHGDGLTPLSEIFPLRRPEISPGYGLSRVRLGTHSAPLLRRVMGSKAREYKLLITGTGATPRSA